MSLPKLFTLAALVLSTSPASAGETGDRGLVGTWQPMAAETHYADATVLIFNEEGRFAALVAQSPEAESNGLATTSGTWTLGEDGGEVVLELDQPSQGRTPGSSVFVQMLLLEDELHPYPGMEDRSPVAAIVWRRALEALASGQEERASR